MSGRFDGRGALVTGGTTGIGRATAQAFAREGAAVVDRFGRLDLAFNNAGVEQPRRPVTAVSDDELDRLVAVNPAGPLRRFAPRSGS